MRLKTFATSMMLGLMIASSSFIAIAQDNAATPGVLGEPVEHECVTELGTTDVPENATAYVINSEESQVQFTVTEELAGQGLNDAIGTTNAIIGTLLVDGDGNPLPCGRIDVDLRTLQTDEARRDSRMLSALNVNDYPVATFVVTEIAGLNGPLEDGTETKVTLIGNLAISGVEHQVSWDTTVTLQDGVVTGTASTIVRFDDYGVSKPVMGPVMSIEDEIHLTISIVAPAQ